MLNLEQKVNGFCNGFRYRQKRLPKPQKRGMDHYALG